MKDDIIKKTRIDQRLYYGHKYTLDPNTGYYVSTTYPRKRLHVAVWEHTHSCSVPSGCVIHHIDFNKSNNNPDNLVCLTVAEHNAIHNPSTK